MGQKLEKLSEKDEESLDNSDWSEQTGETQQSETSEQFESRDQDDGSFVTSPNIGGISGISVSGPMAGHEGEHARTDPQTGQPIRPLCQPLNSRRELVGGDRESQSISQTVEESKTVLSPTESRQTLNKKQGSGSKAVAFFWTTAMEEQENKKKSKTGCSKFGPDAQSMAQTASCDPTNEEDFVVLERDETWTSSDGESNPIGNRIKTDNRQSCVKRKVQEDSSAAHGNNQSPRNTPQDKGSENKSRRPSDTLSVITDRAEAHTRSTPAACFESEMGQRLAEVTGGRCQLKGVSHVGAARAGTTGGGKAEREHNLNGHSKGQVSTHMSRQNSSSNDLESVRGEDGSLVSQQEVVGEKAGNTGLVGKVSLSLRDSQSPDKETPSSKPAAQKPKGEQQSYLSRFAGVVSKRAKASTLSSRTKKEDGQAVSKAAADSHPTKAKPPSSETPQLQDNFPFPLEQCDEIPPLRLPGNEGCDGKTQVACLKRESELVCFSAMVTPPPLTHVLSDKNTTKPRQQATEPDATSTSRDSRDESVPDRKPKVKGPPPPVPKKPKNPFIKLKTAQLMSTDVQRRNKDHLRSEEKVKRRHTFHFNKDLPCIPQTNQDMCLLWDERGTYAVPTNVRRLSIDLGPWQHLSLAEMDERYGDMIDYDYCMRIAKLSPDDEEPQNLDMTQRRVFLERRSRHRSSPPPAARKPQGHYPSTETLHVQEGLSDMEIQRPDPACSGKREIYPELLSERVSAQVSNDRAAYGLHKDVTDHSGDRDAGNGSEVGSYKPVAEIVREKNQMQRHHGRVKPEGPKAQIRVAEQSPNVKVSQMKNAFDVPKKSKERPPEVQPSPKKGKDFVGSSNHLYINKHVCYIRIRACFQTSIL